MIPVHIHYSDGHYSLTRTDIGHTRQWETNGFVTEDEWKDYEALCAHESKWREKIVEMDNEWYRSHPNE